MRAHVSVAIAQGDAELPEDRRHVSSFVRLPDLACVGHLKPTFGFFVLHFGLGVPLHFVVTINTLCLPFPCLTQLPITGRLGGCPRD